MCIRDRRTTVNAKRQPRPDLLTTLKFVTCAEICEMYDKHDTRRAIDAHRRDVVKKLRGPQMHFVVVVVLVEHVLESPRGARDTTLVSLEALEDAAQAFDLR